MRTSDIVAKYILSILEKTDGNAEIKRNELACQIGCVPSQINYVITSRFTPEQGYIVESKRGGGGYIRIRRVKMDNDTAIMHIINSVGDKLSFKTANIMLQNMYEQRIITFNTLNLILSAISERTYFCIPVEFREYLRASIFKSMLLTQT